MECEREQEEGEAGGLWVRLTAIAQESRETRETEGRESKEMRDRGEREQGDERERGGERGGRQVDKE